MDTIEKVYCTGHDNNDALVAALASKNNCDPNLDDLRYAYAA